MWLRALFVDHFWLKLFSLLLAILVWLAVRANVSRELVSREFDAREATTNFIGRPIYIMTESGSHPPLNIDPPMVDIAIRGGLSEIRRVDANDLRAFVRISGRADFDGTVPVHVQLPKDTALVMVSPAVVHVKTVTNP
jgi:hypothetical protein